MPHIAVESVIFGDPSCDNKNLESINLDVNEETITIRQLINRVVKKQIKYYLEEKKVTVNVVKLMLRRQYLTAADIKEQENKGKIAFGAENNEAEEDSNVIAIEEECDHAISGFKSKSYRVFLDGEPMDDLNDEVILKPSSSVTFIRLIPLVGG